MSKKKTGGQGSKIEELGQNIKKQESKIEELKQSINTIISTLEINANRFLTQITLASQKTI